MAFVDMWSELATILPELSPLLAQKLVNKAWQDIRQRRSWSFLFYPALLNAPTMVNAGTVTVATGSTTVTLDATAEAALQALVTSGFPLPGLQFRVQNAGPVYTILTYDGAVTITLNQPIQIQNGPGLGYAVYQSLFPGPVTDFLRWISVYDPNNGYALTRLDVDQREINRIDPTRSNQGQSYWISPVNNLALPNQPVNFLYEFWPTPVQGQQFQVLLKRAGLPFANSTDTQPPTIPDELILWRAKYFAYQWAEANKSRFPALKLGGWSYLMREHNEPKQGWPRMLATVAKEDNEIRDNSIVFPEKRLGVFPIDSGFWQSHDVGWFGWTGIGVR